MRAAKAARRAAAHRRSSRACRTLLTYVAAEKSAGAPLAIAQRNSSPFPGRPSLRLAQDLRELGLLGGARRIKLLWARAGNHADHVGALARALV